MTSTKNSFLVLQTWLMDTQIGVPLVRDSIRGIYESPELAMDCVTTLDKEPSNGRRSLHTEIRVFATNHASEFYGQPYEEWATINPHSPVLPFSTAHYRATTHHIGVPQ